jgi:hypothetical protein
MCHLRTHLLLEKFVNDTYLHVSQNETRRYQSRAHLTCTFVPLPIVTIVCCHSYKRLVIFIIISYFSHFIAEQAFFLEICVNSSLNSKAIFMLHVYIGSSVMVCFLSLFSSRACLHIIFFLYLSALISVRNILQNFLSETFKTICEISLDPKMQINKATILEYHLEGSVNLFFKFSLRRRAFL